MNAMDIISQISEGPVSFICENYRIWNDNRCTGGSYYNGIITIAATSSDSYQISIEGETPVEMNLDEPLAFFSEQGNKATLRSVGGRECTFISQGGSITCMRVTLGNRTSFVEYYGKVQSSGMRTAPKREIKLPSKKNEYRDELYEELRLLLRENIYSPGEIDIQAEIVAYASKKFMEFYDSYHDQDRDTLLEPMRKHIFTDTWTLIYSEILKGRTGMYLDGLVADAREWYDNLTRNPGVNVRYYIARYYEGLHAPQQSNLSLLLGRYAY